MHVTGLLHCTAETSQAALVVKNPSDDAGDVGKIPWRRAWQSTLVFLPGESQGQRSLAGFRPWSCIELDMTEATDYTLRHTPQKLIQHCEAITFHF